MRRTVSECETEIVRRAVGGSLVAFGLLVERYRSAVFLIAEEALGNRTEAEDITQEVFLIAFQSLTKLKEPEKFASWLYAIARFRSRKVFRRDQRMVVLSPEQIGLLQEYMAPVEANPLEESLLRSEEAKMLESATESLKPEWRLVVLLRYREQWSIGQIAQFLALTTNTVNWRLHEARRFLKQHLETQERNNNNE